MIALFTVVMNLQIALAFVAVAVAEPEADPALIYSNGLINPYTYSAGIYRPYTYGSYIRPSVYGGYYY